MKTTTNSKFNKLSSCSIIKKEDLKFYKNTKTRDLRDTKKAHLFDNLKVELLVASRMCWLDITK